MTGLHRIVQGIARVMALAGGAVLSLLIVITCLSILGRAANTMLHSLVDWGVLAGPAQWLIDAGIGAIRGSYEMVEAGMAFCIFAFLPFCQVTAGHASVDVFTNALPRGVNRVLETLISILFATVLVLIAVQLNAGMLRKLGSGQTSLLLEFPVWWAYAASLIGAVMAALAAVYVALVRVFELLTGRVVMANAIGANH